MIVASFKGQKLFAKVSSLAENVCSKAVQSVILTLCSAPTAVLSPSFSFCYKAGSSGAVQPTRAVGGQVDQEVALLDVAFVLLFSFLTE